MMQRWGVDLARMKRGVGGEAVGGDGRRGDGGGVVGGGDYVGEEVMATEGQVWLGGGVG